MREPRDPLLKVVFDIISFVNIQRLECCEKGGRFRIRNVHRCENHDLEPDVQPKRTVQSQCVARGAVSLMILPQVHLRKPCYDFYFL
jgi:hypothetical protein